MSTTSPSEDARHADVPVSLNKWYSMADSPIVDNIHKHVMHLVSTLHIIKTNISSSSSSSLCISSAGLHSNNNNNGGGASPRFLSCQTPPLIAFPNVSSSADVFALAAEAKLRKCEIEASNFRRELFELIFQLIPKNTDKPPLLPAAAVVSTNSNPATKNAAGVDDDVSTVYDRIATIFSLTEFVQHTLSECLRLLGARNLNSGMTRINSNSPPIIIKNNNLQSQRQQQCVSQLLRQPQQQQHQRQSGALPPPSQHMPKIRQRNDQQQQQHQLHLPEHQDVHRCSDTAAVIAATTISIPPEWITPCHSITSRWEDVIGAGSAVEALQQAVTLPLRFPEIFLLNHGHCSGSRVSAAAENEDENDSCYEWDGDGDPNVLSPTASAPEKDSKSTTTTTTTTFKNTPWRALCLWGPCGTGKTQLARATAAEAGACLIAVSAADLLSKYVGESEKSVRQLFESAAALRQRCVVFLDEIDALCAARGSVGETEAARRVKTEFLLRAQHLPEHVLLLAATNFPWSLDSAFCRRFDQFIYVGLPDLKARFQILCTHLSCSRRGRAVQVQDAAAGGLAAVASSRSSNSNNNKKNNSNRAKKLQRRNSGDGAVLITTPRTNAHNNSSSTTSTPAVKGGAAVAAAAVSRSTAVMDEQQQNQNDDKCHQQQQEQSAALESLTSATAERGTTLSLPDDALLTMADVFETARRLEGYSGSDLVAVAKHALVGPVRRLQRATHFTFDAKKNKYIVAATATDAAGNGGGNSSSASAAARRMSLNDIEPGKIEPLPLSKQDLDAASSFYRKTCSSEDLARYEAWSAQA